MIRKITEFLLFSNLFIALGAASLCLANQLLLPTEFIQPRTALFAFGATCVSYIFHRFNVLGQREQNKDNAVIAWSKKNLHYLKMLVALVGLAAFYQFFQFNFNSRVLLAFVALISIAYSRPLFGKPLRDLPFAKIFLISFNWGACTALLVASEAGALQEPHSWLVFAQSFLLIFCLTIPFDIRDFRFDQAEKLATIPTRFGVRTAKRIGYFLFVVWLGINVYLAPAEHLLVHALVSIFFMCLGLFAISKTKEEASEKYFLGVIDGLIIVWGLLVWGIAYFT